MKNKITQKKVMNDFNKLKKYANKCYEQGDYSQSLCAIETASKLMYTYNVLYTDYDMEKMLSDIALNILDGKQREITKCKEKKIIFYDYFAVDNRGLTQQYITALIDLEYEILFITYEHDNMNQSEQIFSQLNKYKKAEIHTIKNNHYVESSKELYQVINNFGATKALIHTSPWDVVGVLTFSYLIGVERYLINLTDHAFWLGKCCSDYILEFRSYGYNISRTYRNISEDKLILLPFYPIQDMKIPFEGFPFEANGKKVIFSGGSVYKIYGSDIFFRTIKYIVENHKDTIVLYAGGGNTKPFEKFIKDNKLSDKVFLIKERKDIVEIFKNCYFYLGTYPISGGLMTQYAVANKKLPIAYSHPELKTNFIESLLINVNNRRFTFTNLRDYYGMIDKLIDNPKYKNKLEESLNNLLVTPAEFAENLAMAIENKSTMFLFKKDEINIDKFSDLYFQMENDYLHDYYLIFARSKNVKLLLEFMNIGIFKALIKVILKKIKNF